VNLKDLVEETLCSIIDAVTELQAKYDGSEALINPAQSHTENDQSEEHTSHEDVRRIQTVAFDVAVTVANETTGETGGKMKVLPVDLSTMRESATSGEQLSRIRFEIPVSLPMSSDDERHAALLSEERERKREMIDHARERSRLLSEDE